MRYPTRAYQPDTTVASNDRRHLHQASQNESRPGYSSGRLSPTHLTDPPTYQVLKTRVVFSFEMSSGCHLRHQTENKYDFSPVVVVVVVSFALPDSQAQPISATAAPLSCTDQHHPRWILTSHYDVTART
jgi:hypothetical protein